MKKILLVSVLLLLSVVGISAQKRFSASLSGAQEVPANGSAGKGSCTIVLNAAETQITLNCTFSGLGTNLTAAHIHGNGAVGVNAPILFNFTGLPTATSGTIGPLNFAVTAQQVLDMKAHLFYVNLHTTGISTGEIRGQVKQAHTIYDTDGDGRTDPTIFRQSTNTFWSQSSLNGASQFSTMGTGTGDIFLNNTCDFDGDGLGDPLLLKLNASNIAIWTVFQTSTGTVRSEQWGNFTTSNGETLAISDYDGDGKQDIGIFRRATGVWMYIESSTNAQRFIPWGTTNDFPSVGDYDGDGKADLTAVRIESGQRVWYILRSSDGQYTRTTFGASATDGVFFFAPFDIDGDGKQDIAVNRIISSVRTFFAIRSSDGALYNQAWGLNTDTAFFGDYDGDGKTDLVARRNVGGVFNWIIRRSSDGAEQYHYWGITADQ